GVAGWEGDEVAGDVEAGLLGEFAPRRLQRVFVGAELALGNRPGMRILARPERTAGVDEEDLDPTVAPPEQQKARALFGHDRPVCPKPPPRKSGSRLDARRETLLHPLVWPMPSPTRVPRGSGCGTGSQRRAWRASPFRRMAASRTLPAPRLRPRGCWTRSPGRAPRPSRSTPMRRSA